MTQSIPKTPLKIAERFAAVTGFTDADPKEYEVGGAGFLLDGFGLDEARVVFTVGDRTVECPIGDYDPLEGWRFHNEYVSGEEKSFVANHLDQNLLPSMQKTIAKRINKGTPVVMLRDPYTVKKRQEVARQMTQLGLEVLIERTGVRQSMAGLVHDPDAIEVDESSFCYPVITRELVELNENMYALGRPLINLQIIGFKVDNPAYPGHTFRASNAIELAAVTSDPDLKGMWVPQLDHINLEEWIEVVMPAASMLMEARLENPDFSVASAAIAYNDPIGGSFDIIQELD